MSALTPTRYKAAIGFILVTAALDILSMGLVIPVLPPLIEEFVGSSSGAGWWNGLLVALWAGAQLAASPILGSLSDRYGRRPVVLISTAGLAADWVLMALAPNLWWLAVGRILGGATSASFTVIYAYMADIAAPEDRAKGFGLIGAAFAGGFVLGPALGGLLGEIGPRAPFWAAAAMSTLAFAYGLFILPESLKPENRMAFSWKRANPFGAMALLGRHTDLTRLAVVNFLLYFAHHVFSAVFVLYAAHRFGWSPWQVGASLALAGLLDMAVQGGVTGAAVRRFGDRRVMVFGLLGGVAGLAMLGWAPTGLLFVLALFPNALWGLAMPTLQALMTRRVGENEQGQLQGANMSVASVAGVASPLFFGWIYMVSAGEGAFLPHPGAAFFIAALVLLAAGLIGLSGARGVRD